LRAGGLALHRMDQVIGNLDAFECPLESFTAENVPADHLDLWNCREHALGVRGIACQDLHPMPLGEKPWYERRADEAAGSRDEDAHG
jgi:hypothetical protein